MILQSQICRDTPTFLSQQYLWNIAIQPAVGCYNSWANFWGLGCLPLGEKLLWNRSIHMDYIDMCYAFDTLINFLLSFLPYNKKPWINIHQTWIWHFCFVSKFNWCWCWFSRLLCKLRFNQIIFRVYSMIFITLSVFPQPPHTFISCLGRTHWDREWVWCVTYAHWSSICLCTRPCLNHNLLSYPTMASPIAAVDIDGLAQDCSNPIAKALELVQSFT